MLAAGACNLYDGDLPPQDELNYPTSLIVHPDGRYLYVISSNFEGIYRDDLGGTLSIIDLETRELLSDRTLCLPSYGDSLVFGPSNYGDPSSPVRLFGVTRADDGAFSLTLSQDGSVAQCGNIGTLDTGSGAFEGVSTCVNDVADLEGVSRRERRLPCVIDELLGDPATSAMLPAGDDDAHEVQVVGGLSGGILPLNWRNGQIDDDEVPDPRFLVNGTIAMETHPLTGDIYVGGRFSSFVSAVRAVRNGDEGGNDPDIDGDDAGAIRAMYSVGGVRIPLPSNGISGTQRAEIRDLKFSADGSRLYITSNNPDSLAVADVSLNADGEARNTFLRRFDIDGDPTAMFVSELSGRALIYIAVYQDSEIRVVDAESGERIDTIDVGATPWAMVADPVRPLIYVSLFSSDAIGVIDIDPLSPTRHRLVGTIH